LLGDDLNAQAVLRVGAGVPLEDVDLRAGVEVVDGSILVSDDKAGAVYRISYQK